MENICWNITHKCNLNCKHCFRETNEKDLTLDENINILNKLISQGVKKITWSGGEPTEYKGIERLLKIAKENGIYNKLVSNASNFVEENSYNIFDYIDEVIFSIDSVNEKVNEEIGRGSGYYKNVKKVIHVLKVKYPKCNISINTIVMKPNYYSIDDIYCEIKELGIKKWKLIQFCSFRGIAKYNKDFLEITSREYNEVIDRYKTIINDFEIVGHTSKQVENEHIIVSSSGNIVKK